MRSFLTDNRNSIQYWSTWSRVRDKAGVVILQHLYRLSAKCVIYLQWIPSHVGIYRNEIADTLTKQGTTDPLPKNLALTFMEIFSIRKRNVQKKKNLEMSSCLQLVLWRWTGSCYDLQGKLRQSDYVYQIYQWLHKVLEILTASQVFPTYNKQFSITISPVQSIQLSGFFKENFLHNPILFCFLFSEGK